MGSFGSECNQTRTLHCSKEWNHQTYSGFRRGEFPRWKKFDYFPYFRKRLVKWSFQYRKRWSVKIFTCFWMDCYQSWCKTFKQASENFCQHGLLNELLLLRTAIVSEPQPNLKPQWNPIQQKPGQLNVSIWYQWFIAIWVNSTKMLWNGVIYGERESVSWLFWEAISPVLLISKKNIIFELHSSNSTNSFFIRDGRWSWSNIFSKAIRSVILKGRSISSQCPSWIPMESRQMNSFGQNCKSRSIVTNQRLFLFALLKIAIRRKLHC